MEEQNLDDNKILINEAFINSGKIGLQMIHNEHIKIIDSQMAHNEQIEIYEKECKDQNQKRKERKDSLHELVKNVNVNDIDENKKQNAIAKAIVKTKLPRPKIGSCKPRIFNSIECNKNELCILKNNNHLNLLWSKQLDNFTKEFKKHHDNDKTYRDVIIYEYEIKGSCNTIDEFLLDILRDRMYYIGYKVALEKRVDDNGRILYQSY